MAAKFLRSINDDSADFQRQMGCITGIFQLFDRQNMLTGGRRLIGHTSKRTIPSGSSHSSQTKSENHSMRNIQRVSMDMSRASVSSSSHSSSFSSLDNNTRTPQSDSASFDRMIFPDNPSDIRDLIKDSIYREQLQGLKSKLADALTVSDRKSNQNEARELSRSSSYSCDGSKGSLKTKDLPRRSLEVSSSRSLSAAAIDGPRIPSVVAKLMGLETLPDSDADDSASCSFEETNSRKPSPGFAMRFPIEPAPWKRMEGGTTKGCSQKNSSRGGGHHRAAAASLFPSVYNEIEERFKDLEFMQSGKDLRALKQILGRMQSTGERSKGVVSASGRKLQNNYEPSNVIVLKPVKYFEKKHGTATQVSAKSAKDGKNSGAMSPRMPKKKVETEKKSLPPTRPVVSGKSRRFSNKPRNSQLRRNSSFSEVEDNSTAMMSSNSQNAGIPEKESGMAWSEEESPESGFVPPEYSSPVSVLDNGVLKSDSPPNYVGKTLKVDSTEKNQCPKPVDFNRKKLESIENLVEKLRRVNSSHDEARIDYIASLCENSNPDHRYVSEILLASGLLLMPSVRDFDFHPSGHPINPELFLVLEQTKGGTAFPGSSRVHRKLVFDAANEILAGRLSSEKCGGTTGQMVLRDVCSEIEILLRGGRIPKCDDDKEDDDGRQQWKNAVSDDVMSSSVRWIDPKSGISGPVLDIERMIFKDLVNEIVIGESPAKIGRRKIVGAAK